MGLTYHHLDDPYVRAEMVQAWSEEHAELHAEDAVGRCYGRRLSPDGIAALVDAMPHALDRHDDEWLIGQLDRWSYWRNSERRRSGKTGRTAIVHFNPRDALEQLCIGEFNTAYVRGLARALLRRGETHALVYRAGPAREPDAECTGWEDSIVPLGQILAGHRARYWPPPGDPYAFSIPARPSCHHSIRAMPAGTVM